MTHHPGVWLNQRRVLTHGAILPELQTLSGADGLQLQGLPDREEKKDLGGEFNQFRWDFFFYFDGKNLDFDRLQSDQFKSENLVKKYNKT